MLDLNLASKWPNSFPDPPKEGTLSPMKYCRII
jgi:hypothetical protein